MRVALPAVLITVVFAVAPIAQSGTVESQVAQLERDFHQARFKNDVPAVNRFFAADYYAINTGGGRTEAGNKGTGPFDTTPNGDTWEKIEVRDQRVKVYGDTAVSTYLRHINVRNRDGSAREVNLVGSHVWVRRNGQWQLVLSQGSEVPQR